MRRTIALAAGAIAAGLAFATSHPSLAESVDDALRTATRALSSPATWSAVNVSIDQALAASGLAARQMTRVVPIVGYGRGAGGLRLAQVAGPETAVTRVKAVLEIDNVTSSGPWQFSALVPVSSIDGRGSGRRVDGVGVTALVTR